MRAGGMHFVLKIQMKLKNRGAQGVEIDGKVTKEMRKAMLACLRDIECGQHLFPEA